jgi:uncharacterized membrane protein
MIEAAPSWVLSIAYWLHMLATVVWIGGLSALSLIVLPAARRSITGAAYGDFLGQVQQRLQGIGWFSLVLLFVTGMLQMSSSPFSEGFLAIDNPWALAILLKHLAIGLMVLLGAYATWGIAPALRRLALLQAAGRGVDETAQDRLRRREDLLLKLNLVVSLVVLLLTAIARSA